MFGTVATRGPKSPLANTAFTELDQACLLFSKAAAYSKRAKKALVLFLDSVPSDGLIFFSADFDEVTGKGASC